MDPLAEVVTLIRRHAELELALIQGDGTAATEHALDTTRRRLAAHPHTLNAVVQTARALGRTPDSVSAQDVRTWDGSD